MSVAPGFTDAGAGQYTLAGDSPLVDKGVRIPGVNDDYTGLAPDLGAYELGSAPVAVPGVCGSADGATVDTAPTAGLCATGDPTVVSGTGPWSWTCRGRNGGADQACSATASGGGGAGGGAASGGCATGGDDLPLSALGLLALLRRAREGRRGPARGAGRRSG